MARVVSSCLLNRIVKKGVTEKRNKKTKTYVHFFLNLSITDLTGHHMDTSVPCIRSPTVSLVKRLLHIYKQAQQSIIMNKRVSFTELRALSYKNPPTAMQHILSIRSPSDRLLANNTAEPDARNSNV